MFLTAITSALPEFKLGEQPDMNGAAHHMLMAISRIREKLTTHNLRRHHTATSASHSQPLKKISLGSAERTTI